MPDLLSLAVLVSLCLMAGGLGGSWTAASVKTWYPTLKKPAWNPPASVFAPVWTVLYILMGIAIWRIAREGALWRLPGGLFLVQLLLNVAWSWLFFARRRVDLAFADILLLWAAILATILAFAPVDPTAAWLLAPYLAWVTFASVLNGAIFALNRASTPPA